MMPLCSLPISDLGLGEIGSRWDRIMRNVFVPLELQAGRFHAAESSNPLGCVCCCPTCCKRLTQQPAGLCSAAASIDPSFPCSAAWGIILLVSVASNHVACTLLLRFWVWEILEQTWHFCASEIMEEGMAATSWDSQEQQPELCAMFWLVGSRWRKKTLQLLG